MNFFDTGLLPVALDIIYGPLPGGLWLRPAAPAGAAVDLVLLSQHFHELLTSSFTMISFTSMADMKISSSSSSCLNIFSNISKNADSLISRLLIGTKTLPSSYICLNPIPFPKGQLRIRSHLPLQL